MKRTHPKGWSGGDEGDGSRRKGVRGMKLQKAGAEGGLQKKGLAGRRSPKDRGAKTIPSGPPEKAPK